jgi:hypothetical protein
MSEGKRASLQLDSEAVWFTIAPPLFIQVAIFQMEGCETKDISDSILRQQRKWRLFRYQWNLSLRIATSMILIFHIF